MYPRRTTSTAGALVSALALAAALGVLGAHPAAAGSPTVTVPPVPLPRPVTACGTLAVPGTYLLTADLHASGNCLVVKAAHVVVNLAGHTVSGPWAALKGGGWFGPGGLDSAVLVEPKAVGTRVESTLPGGAVTNFSIGVRTLARGTVIAGPYLSVDNNVDAGVLLSRAAASVVKQLSESGNGGFGIHVELSKGAALRDNIVNGSQVYGIWDQESAGTQIIGNTVELSRIAGIYLGCSSSADLQDVGCAAPSDSSKIEHNSLLDNGDYGIAISEDSMDNYVYGNNVAGDTSYDLEDENTGCASGATVPPNSWLKNTGDPNQTTSPNCIG